MGSVPDQNPTTTHDVFESVGDILAGLAALDDDGRFRVFVDLRLPLALRPQRLGVTLLRNDVPGRHGSARRARCLTNSLIYGVVSWADAA